MPALSGTQTNLLLFEVGMRTVREAGGEKVVDTLTLGLHPLVISPRLWRYNDQTRSSVMQLAGRSIVVKGGRQLLTMTLAGMFGVADAGLGAYQGSGTTRFKRVWNEVVRLSDAITTDQVDEAIDLLHGTPGLSQALSSFDPDASTFYINAYDFWFDRAYECLVQSFSPERRYDGGGATGNTHYSMILQQVGPLVGGQVTEALLGDLLDATTFWTGNLTGNLTGNELAEVLASETRVPEAILTQLSTSLDGLVDQLPNAQGVMGGQRPQDVFTAEGASGVVDFFQLAEDTAQAAARAGEAMRSRSQSGGRTETLDVDPGVIDWSTSGDTSSSTLEGFVTRMRLYDAEFAADSQRVIGTLYGLSESEFVEHVTGGGNTAHTGPDVAASTVHRVGPADTGERIARRYNVPWRRILAANNLTPDLALVQGTELAIPTSRRRGAQGIDGLPTFDSHIGLSALGQDLDAELAVDPDGALLLVTEGDCVLQGVELMLADEAAALLNDVNQLPGEVQRRYLERRLSTLFVTDRRVVGISDLSVQFDDSGSGLSVDVELITVNAGTIRSQRGV